MAQLGFKTVNEMVGQVQKLDRKKAIEHYKAAGVDLTPILHQIDIPKRDQALQYGKTKTQY